MFLLLSSLDFKEKYYYVLAGTLEPMRNNDVLTKNSCFCCTPAFENTSKTHNDIKFGIEVKTILVVDISLNSNFILFLSLLDYFPIKIM